MTYNQVSPQGREKRDDVAIYFYLILLLNKLHWSSFLAFDAFSMTVYEVKRKIPRSKGDKDGCAKISPQTTKMITMSK